MSSGKVVSFGTGTVGVDKTGASISEANATELYGLGYRFALRSIGVPTSVESQEGALTAAEIQDLWAGGLAVSVFQLNFFQTTIDAEQGTADGDYLVEQANALGLPGDANPPFTLWFDLEGAMQDASAEELEGYLNAWAKAVTSQGYGAGLYVGNNGTLTTADISNLPDFHAYWQCGGYLYVGMPQRGYQMYQLYPFGVTIADIPVDIDVVQSDFQDCQVPFWGPPDPAPVPGGAGARALTPGRSRR